MDHHITIGRPIAPTLVAIAEQAHDYARNAKAENTRRGYRSDWKDFTAWTAARGLCALPADPETVALYITDLAGRLKTATIMHRLATISEAHKAAGLESPTRTSAVQLVASGIRRTKGTAQVGKAPILTADLRAMLDALPSNLIGARDRALLLVGFAGAFRRSELVGLNVEDVTFNTEGMVVTLRRSKTDQEGKGATVGIPHGRGGTCPVTALREWLQRAEITDGPLFRAVGKGGRVMADRLNDKTVARVVKRTVEAAGLDPDQFAGHSLRAGLATQAAINGASDRAIMKQTRHRTRAMVDRYVRDASLFRNNAAAAIGL
jgi:integrase